MHGELLATDDHMAVGAIAITRAATVGSTEATHDAAEDVVLVAVDPTRRA